jgi:hypothetical protein
MKRWVLVTRRIGSGHQRVPRGHGLALSRIEDRSLRWFLTESMLLNDKR